MTIDRAMLREHARACRTDPYGIVMSGEELDAILDALEQAEAERDWNLRSSRRAKEQRIKANTRADQAEARIQAVRALHVASGPSGVICDACNVVTPCPTIRVLDSDGDPGQSCGRGPCALGYGHPGACRC